MVRSKDLYVYHSSSISNQPDPLMKLYKLKSTLEASNRNKQQLIVM